MHFRGGGIPFDGVASRLGCCTSDLIVRVNSFSTRLLSRCTDEYAHTYDISTY